ncbi:YNL260C [Zygosaccharomyces parabailii]|nr:YNL260C [Zygosaccharomyces parabailii]
MMCSATIMGQLKLENSDTMTPVDLDSLLDLEDEYYQKGLEEGSAENVQHNYLEGKQYGLQVGFQRYLLLGQISGLLDVLEVLDGDKKVFAKKIESVRALLSGLKMDNEDSSVADFEDRFIKIKNKFRTILLLLQKQLKAGPDNTLSLAAVERVSLSIAEELKGHVEDDSDTSDVLQDQTKDW